MKWIREYNGTYSECVLNLTAYEAKMLQEILKPVRSQYERRVRIYRDIHDGGEASSRTETALARAEERLAMINTILNQ